jgi:5'-nucleotidase
VLALITNDDGIASPGIRALAQAAVDAGLDVTVAAPSWDSSGASASLTSVERDGRLQVDPVVLEGLEEVDAYAVEAAPAFIVRAATTGAFGEPPDIVLSGVNLGPNLGQAVLHSGTVGAVLTAGTLGRPGLAVSIGTGDTHHWVTAREVAAAAIGWLAASGRRTILNVNVPNVPPEDLRGLEPARLAAFGAVQAVMTESGSGYVKLAYEGIDAELEPGTDAALVADGFASVTALRAVCEADHDDLAIPLLRPHADAVT